VNKWLMGARFWQLTLLCGVPLAVGATLVMLLWRHKPWPEAVVAGVATGMLCGLVVALFSAGQLSGTRELCNSVDSDPARQVLLRGSLCGPVPTDPEARAVLTRQVEQQLEAMERRRVTGPVLSLVAAAVVAWLALERSPWWWAAVVVFVLLIPLTPLTRAKLRRRLEELRGGSAGE
jgi:hypothetical protein